MVLILCGSGVAGCLHMWGCMGAPSYPWGGPYRINQSAKLYCIFSRPEFHIGGTMDGPALLCDSSGPPVATPLLYEYTDGDDNHGNLQEAGRLHDYVSRGLCGNCHKLYLKITLRNYQLPSF